MPDVVQTFIENSETKIVDISDFGKSMNLLPATLNSVPTECEWSCFLKRWATQEGYPLVRVTLLGDGKFKVTQEPFIGNNAMKLRYAQVERNNKEELCWPIPLPYKKLDLKTEIDVEKWTWVSCDRTKETVKQFDQVETMPKTLEATNGEGTQIENRVTNDDIYLFNMDYKSLLRVKYDENTWEKIHKLYVDNKLNYQRSIFRAQWILDAFSLAWAGYQDWKYAFRTIKLCNDVVTWNAFFTGAHRLNEILKTSPDTYQLFRTFIGTVMSKQYLETYKNGGDIFGKLKRLFRVRDAVPKNDADELIHFWSCTVAGIERCTSEAIKVFDAWTQGDAFYERNLYFISFDDSFSILVYTVLCTVLAEMKHDNERDVIRFDIFMENMWSSIDDEPFQEKYMSAIQCVTDVKILNKGYSNVDYWIHSKYGSLGTSPLGRLVTTRTVNMFLYLVRGKFTFSHAFTIFRDHTNTILKLCVSEEDTLKEIVQTLAYKSDEAQLSLLESTIKSTQSRYSGAMLKALDEGKEARKVRLEWMKNNESNIKTLISDYASLNP